jgi:cytochrome P450
LDKSLIIVVLVFLLAVLYFITHSSSHLIPVVIVKFNYSFILSGMKYLQQVIKETMRLQPVVAGGMVRQVPKDIEHNGFIIPKVLIIGQ